MCAAILGDRKWPRDVPTMAFIIQTMRSLASHQRAKHRREMADGGAAHDAAGGAAVMFSDAASSPEQILIEQESEDTVRVIYDSFERDEEAQMLVLGWSEGYRGKELRELLGVDQAALDYVIKRVGRAMTKRYPHGWKKP
jgi:DNA-directed RNA polymerase specialized sigma24 family protein